MHSFCCIQLSDEFCESCFFRNVCFASVSDMQISGIAKKKTQRFVVFGFLMNPRAMNPNDFLESWLSRKTCFCSVFQGAHCECPRRFVVFSLLMILGVINPYDFRESWLGRRMCFYSVLQGTHLGRLRKFQVCNVETTKPGGFRNSQDVRLGNTGNIFQQKPVFPNIVRVTPGFIRKLKTTKSCFFPPKMCVLENTVKQVFLLNQPSQNRRGYLVFMRKPNTTKRRFFCSPRRCALCTLKRIAKTSSSAKPGFTKIIGVTLGFIRKPNTRNVQNYSWRCALWKHWENMHFCTTQFSRKS